MRIGHGYDVHRLVSGRPCIIGGVNIPFELGLDGHSDADVLTHAVMDSLLGALALGADAVMIGRGCFGNPWLFQQCRAALAREPVPPLPPLAERVETALRQFHLAAQDKGEHIALLEARKQLCWYLKGVSHANYYKEQIVRLTTLEELYRVAAGVRRDLR